MCVSNFDVNVDVNVHVNRSEARMDGREQSAAHDVVSSNHHRFPVTESGHTRTCFLRPGIAL